MIFFQYSTSTLLLLGLAASIVAQYGIPDDDDDKPVVRTPLRFSPPAHVFKAPATTNPPAYQEQVRSFPENYEYRHEVPAYAELPAVFKTVVELREEPKDYDKPVVKVAAKPYEAPSSARIIFKDDSDSTYTPSTRFNLPITTTLIKDSYPSTRLQYSKESVPILKFLLEDDTLGNYRLEYVKPEINYKLIYLNFKTIKIFTNIFLK